MISGYWRWAQKWVLCKNPGFAGTGQFIMGMSLFFWLNLYGFNSKYINICGAVVHHLFGACLPCLKKYLCPFFLAKLGHATNFHIQR